MREAESRAMQGGWYGWEVNDAGMGVGGVSYRRVGEVSGV